MIEIKHLSKTFQMKDGAVNALKDINLTIPDGSIYGIIGMSGAGKSTLVRCINLLERPTEGSVVIDGTAMETLNAAQLRERRVTPTLNNALKVEYCLPMTNQIQVFIHRGPFVRYQSRSENVPSQ